MKKNTAVLALLLLIYILLVFSGCSRSSVKVTAVQSEPVSSVIAEHIGPAWPAVALLRTGENPIWFELGQDGPLHIESPANASLTSFEPWPHARFIIGMQLWEGFLVMAVNQEGFLVLGPGINANEAMLYRVADRGFWSHYTTESFFLWDGRPAALLYRNDFFSEPLVPSPRPQVFVLDFYSSVPMGVNVPALEGLTPEWEAELVRRGPDGLWYYRMREKGREQAETAYFRTLDLAEPGTRISIEEWRSAWSADAEDTALDFLPALSEGFIYTDIAFLGDILVASWEEQEDAGIAASGFMLMYKR